jgi:hypothetical protein
MTTITTKSLANVPHPAGAVRVYEWENPDQPIGAAVNRIHDQTSRYFVSATQVVGRSDADDITVEIDGTQYADGRVERHIVVSQLHADWPLTPGLARELIAVLTAVADEVDQMNGQGRPTAAHIDTRLSSARVAVSDAYHALASAPGNSGDHLKAALDSIDDAIEELR